MFDLNQILNAVFLAAVEQATKPLRERIAALEALENHPALAGVHNDRIMSLELRLATLENNPAQGTDTTLAARVVVLEQSASLDKMRLDDLNERSLRLEGADDATTDAFNRSADRFAGIDAAQRVMVERIQALDDAKGMTAAAFVTYLDNEGGFWEKVSRKAGEVAQTVVEEAMEDHCSGYDHDDYDRVSSAVDDLELDECVKREDLRSEIQDIMDSATVSIRL